ncbi:MAG: UvrD-helicase domain-containing protein [Lewinellaceae bacterium]|nr:UvrD-helicase domain-containing protein [Lewinellaceae bacterium]
MQSSGEEQKKATPQRLSIEVISAGAGSGKTYTLTGRMVDLLKNGVRPAGIMATTFTQKAAAELQERVRIRLLEAGMTEAANELGEALIGTVHSIGTRLLQRFAFEAGVSPLVEIIAESDGQRLFNESLSQVLSEHRIEHMNRLSDRLGLTKKTQGEPYDWRRLIREITDVARANNFSEQVLELSKQRSWQSFERLLPPEEDIEDHIWNNRLLSAIEQTIAAFDANEADGTKTTRDAAEVLRNFENQLRYRGELYWHEWVKIAKTRPGAKSRDLMDDLRGLALSHDAHRRFRSDIREFIALVFDIAIDALGEYEQYKKKRGLIDYTDMETYVSRLLRHERVRATLEREIDLLLVDEFQDTSPIQLDIFLQISRLARRSIWVGDPKQSIYGFRGAEPALMHAIIRATGGVRDENILRKSWRSRPDIVHAVNAIFTRAFPELPAEQVALEPAFRSEKDAQSPRALIQWFFRSELDEKKAPGQPWTDNCIADQIRTFIGREMPVYNKKRTEARPVRPGDIAVLCRSNRGCMDMAAALHRAGLKAAISRAGLLETPEAKLTLACLKFLLTPSDALSMAEILLLTGSMSLEEIVDSRLEFVAAQRNEGAHAERWGLSAGILQHLLDLRPRTADLSASEILNLVLDELDLRRVVVSLGNPVQRLDNLDRLRRFALDYEDACQRLHSAASLGGFLLWLNELADSGLDMQGSGESDDAVKVLTYHRSKGLEFPVAICHNLNQKLKEQIWGVNLVSETEEPDLDNILDHRWIRFWVNPYADQFRGTALEERLLQTPEWAQANRTALDEEARLLYVGLTRARDYLILPWNVQGSKWLNRVFNQGNEEVPTLDPDSDETPFYWEDNALYCDNEALYKPRDFPESLPDLSPVPFHAERKGVHPVPRQSLLIDPVQEMPPGYNPQFREPVSWASWLEFKGDFSSSMEKAVHTFFASDRTGTPPDLRLSAARQQLLIRSCGDSISAEALVRQSDAFQGFLQSRVTAGPVIGHFPFEAWYDPDPAQGSDASLPEGKVSARARLLRLEPDLLIAGQEQVGIVMFAHFAEGMKKWKQQALSSAPVLGWCRLQARQIWPDKTPQCWVVFPMEGQAVELLF